MAMHGAVRQCDGLPAGDRTYRHKRGVAVPALLMSGGWHGRPRARGVVAICMAFGTAARGRRRRSWWRTPDAHPAPVSKFENFETHVLDLGLNGRGVDVYGLLWGY